jgi:hypothetical protein
VGGRLRRRAALLDFVVLVEVLVRLALGLLILDVRAGVERGGVSVAVRLAPRLEQSRHGQLRLEGRRREDEEPLERFDEPGPLPLVAPRVRVDWRFPLDLEDEPPLDLDELAFERDEDPGRAAAISRSVFAPAPRWKRPVRSRGSSSSSFSSCDRSSSSDDSASSRSSSMSE